MVIKVNQVDKNKSIYECDKCGCRLSVNTLHRFVFDKRTYHLCNKHYEILKEWIFKKVIK